MSKIIISISDIAGGGAARVLSILSTPLADNFDEVHIVNWSDVPVFYKYDERIRIIHLPRLSGKKSRYAQMWTFRKYVNQERPDLVLSFLTPYSLLALTATLFMRVRFVVAERTDPNRSVFGGKLMIWLRNLLFLRPVGILTQTAYAKSCYPKFLQRKIEVIYNPVSMTIDYVGKAINEKKRKEVVTVGRYYAVKDIPTMIDAFALFHQKHPDYKLVIYGFGPLKSKIEEKIFEDSLQESILLAGMRDDVWDCIVGTQMFLLSSIVEGMSNAMTEAMCLGLPVISTKVAGATDLINDGENGYLVDVKDSQAMADCMCRLADSEVIRKQIGEEATKVYDLLREDKICKQWIDYLKNVIE